MMTSGKTEQNKPVDSIESSNQGDLNSEGMARRNALAILAKHAAYTAPAVLAVLSITTIRAKAGSF
jgi:hypothetical protein